MPAARRRQKYEPGLTDCYVTLQSVVEVATADRLERASESESSDYEICSSSDDSLGTDVGHL